MKSSTAQVKALPNTPPFSSCPQWEIVVLRLTIAGTQSGKPQGFGQNPKESFHD
jgi:hypothetical protein